MAKIGTHVFAVFQKPTIKIVFLCPRQNQYRDQLSEVTQVVLTQVVGNAGVFVDYLKRHNLDILIDKPAFDLCKSRVLTMARHVAVVFHSPSSFKVRISVRTKFFFQ